MFIDNRLILAVLLIITLIVSFQFCGKRFSSPVIFFVTPFILQSLITYLYYPWDISDSTLYIILGGSITFALVSTLIHHLCEFFPEPETSTRNNEKAILTDLQYLILVFVTIAAIAIVYQGVVSATAGSLFDFAKTLGDFNAAIKSEDESVSIGALPSLIYNLLIGASYAYAYMLAVSICKCKKTKLAYPIILFLIGSLGIMVSGSRTDVIGPMIALILLVLMFKEQAKNRISLSSIPIRVYIFLIIFIIAIIWFFQFSTSLIGRDVEQTPIDYISTYLGASLQNFDYTQTHSSVNSGYFGLNTFKPLYDSLEQLGLVPTGISRSRFPFISRDGYFTGNVYTTYYPLILDFGIIGTMICIAIMAIIMQLLYEYSIRDMKVRFIPIIPIIYSLLNYYMFMSFFASNFFQGITSTGFLKAAVGICLITSYQHICNHYIIVPHTLI